MLAELIKNGHILLQSHTLLFFVFSEQLHIGKHLRPVSDGSVAMPNYIFHHFPQLLHESAGRVNQHIMTSTSHVISMPTVRYILLLLISL
jgi:hypothetical protein